MNTETTVTDAYAMKKEFYKAQKSGGMNKPMTLQEHDKKVHGGHYDGGPCKFRQQMGLKETPKKDGTGGVSSTGAGATGNAAPKKFKMAEGELTKKFGSIEVGSEEAMNHLNEIQQIHAECETPEAKAKVEKIFQDLKAKLSGGGVPSTGTGAEGSDKPKEPAKPAAQNFNSHEEVDNWYNSEMDKLDEAKKNGTISEEDYSKKQDELDTVSEQHHQRIESKPKGADGASDHRKSLRDALVEHLDEKAKSGTMTEEDVAAGEFLEARDYFKKQLDEGKISKAQYDTEMQKLMANHEKARLAKTMGAGQKKPEQKPEPSGEEKLKSVTEHRKKLQSSLEDLHSAFGTNSLIGMLINKHYGKKFGELDNREAALRQDIAKKQSEARSALQKMIGGEGGASNTPKTPRDGLRRIVGGIKHNGNKDVQSMIEEIEEEYANAKTRKEKMALIKEFQQMQKTFGAEGSGTGGAAGGVEKSAPAKKTTRKADAKTSAANGDIPIVNPNGNSLTEKYGNAQGFTMAERNTVPLVEKAWAKAKANGDAARMKVCEDYWKRLMKQDAKVGNTDDDNTFDSSEEGLEMISFAVDELYAEG